MKGVFWQAAALALTLASCSAAGPQSSELGPSTPPGPTPSAQAHGLPPGSKEFKTLFDEVVRKVQEYSTESGDPLDSLQARLPALCALERLAYPAPTVPRNKAGLTLGILIAAVLGPIGIGALVGLGTGMAHWIARLFG